MNKSKNNEYNSEERLLDFGASVIQLARLLNNDYAARHIGNQLLRSGTAPLPHHGEAQGAESRADFIQKMSIALKELRESERWLKLITRSNLLPNNSILSGILSESDELIRIPVTSIRTAKKPLHKS